MKIKWDLNGMKYLLVAVAIFLGVPLAGRAQATVIYVNQATTGATQDGNSWATAYPALSTAMADPRAAGATAANPFVIWVASGTYAPAFDTTTEITVRESTFKLFSHCHIYGGFSGTETSTNSRPNIVNATALTVLSGDLDGAQANGVTGNMSFLDLENFTLNVNDPQFANNCYNVLTGTNVTDVVLDGLVVYGGNALVFENRLDSTVTAVTNHTAGTVTTTTTYFNVYTNLFSQPEIENMSMIQGIPGGGTDTNALYDNPNYYAVYTYGQTMEALDRRAAGGGLFFANAPGWLGNTNPDYTILNLTINGCVFIGNYAQGYGGAVSAMEANSQISSSYFIQNSAGYEGGAFWGLDQLTGFNQCYFGDNLATRSGGAVHLEMLPSYRTLLQTLGGDHLNDIDYVIQIGQTKPATIGILEMFQEQIDLALDTTSSAVDPETFGQKAGAALSGAFNATYNALTDKAVEDGITLGFAVGVQLVKSFGGEFGETLSELPEALLGGGGADVFAGYAAVTGVLNIVDLVFQMVNELDPAAAKNPTFQRNLANWNSFYSYFNAYLTPGGWFGGLEALYNVNQPPTPAAHATAARRQDLLIYNAMPQTCFFSCEFERNSTLGTGGALMASYEPLRVESSRFDDNAAGANAGALGMMDYMGATLISDAFVGNYSEYGHSAVVSAFRVIPVVINCSILNNGSGATNGYALDNEAGADTMIGNSLFWGNTNAMVHSPGGADINTVTKSMLTGNSYSIYTNAATANLEYGWIGMCDIHYSCIQSLHVMPVGHSVYYQGGVPANIDSAGTLIQYSFYNVGEGNRETLLKPAYGNTDHNPLLSSDGISPQLGSPMINAGNEDLVDNDFNYSMTGYDVLNQPRFQGTSVDIGAVENQGSQPQSPVQSGNIIADVFTPFSVQGTNVVGTTNGSGGTFIGPGASPVGLTVVRPFYAAPTNFYINANVSGGNGSGDSWADAAKTFPTNQVLPSGGIIWIAAGTYKLTNGPVRLTPGVSVYGGFAGGETSLARSLPASFPTVISGGGTASSLMTITNGGSLPSLIHGLTFTGANGSGALNLNCPTIVQNCIFSSNVGPGFITTNAFYLTNCLFSANQPGTGVRGAAVISGKGYITNCTFSGNTGIAANVNGNGFTSVIIGGTIFYGNTAAVVGDAALLATGPLTLQSCGFTNNVGSTVVYADDGASVLVNSCQFGGNSGRVASDCVLSIAGNSAVINCGFAHNYGTVLLDNGVSASTISGCQFVANAIGLSPAGLVKFQYGTAANCYFAANQGLAMTASNFTTVTNCQFTQNTGSPVSSLQIYGGAVLNSQFFNAYGGITVAASAPSDSAMYFTNCVFVGDQGGAALSSSADGLELLNCRFDQNYSTGRAGALEITKGAAIIVVGCEFLQNTGGTGAGGIYVTNAQLVLQNCTIVSNTVTGSSLVGGAGVRYDGTDFCSVENTILYGNRLNNNVGVSVAAEQLLAGVVRGSTVVPPAGGALVVDYCLIEGLVSAPAPGSTGCFDAPPGFVGTGNTPVALSAFSPAVNAGTSNNYYSEITLGTDLAGNPRVFTAITNLTGGGTNIIPAVIDIGAYEFQGEPEPRSTVNVSVAQTCSGSVPSFLFTLSTNAGPFQWQIDRLDGNGYVPLVADAINSGITNVQLTVFNPPVTQAGYRYRVISTASPVFESASAALPAYNARVYVKANATGNGSGTNWANAFTSLPAAVQSLTGCGQIWVAAGTYPVTGVYAMSPGPDVEIFGGFAGTETNLSQRNWQLHPTILSASGRSAFDFNENLVVDSGTVIDGFIFNVSGTIAIGISTGTPTIQNCVFTGSTTEAIILSQQSGTGITTISNCQFFHYGEGAIQNDSHTVLQSCLFANNTNSSSTAPFRNTSGIANFYDCRFTNNVGTGAGAIFMDSGTVTVSRCVFLDNTGGEAGAIANTDTLYVDNSLFARNHGFQGTIGSYTPRLQMTYCTVADNVGQQAGGGLYVSGSDNEAIFPNEAGFSVQDCIFWGNSTESSTPVSQENQQIFLEYRSMQSGVLNCLVEGSGNLTGIQNEVYLYTIAPNPLFANEAAGNYQLTAGSPALNRAFTNITASPYPVDPVAPQQMNLMSGLFSYDVNDLSRPYPGTLPDLGAYEFQGAAGTPLTLYDLPTSQTICSSEPGATFFISGGATNSYQWQELVGTNYVNVSTIPQLQVAQVNGPALTNLLIVPATAQFNGAVFRVSVNNGQYLTPGATLTITQPGIIYVNAAAPAGDGLGWATAYNSLAQALTSSGGGCAQIWVAAGTYPCDNDAAGPMHLRSTVQIYGGFSGSETNLCQRDFTNNITRLVPGNVTNYIAADPVLYTPADASAVLDGFDLSGVSLSVHLASPTIRNCIFENNAGYALRAFETGLTVAGCLFQTNGAGISVTSGTNVSVLNSTFVGNTGLPGNSSSSGAVLEFNVCPGLRMSACSVVNNGGVEPGAVSFDEVSATVTNCQFSFNTNTVGATVDIFDSTMVMERCAIVKNSSPEMAAFSVTGSTLSLNDSLVTDNLNTAGRSGEFGGVIYLAGSTLNALNDTVANNMCLGGGSAFALAQGTLNLGNSIVWNNTAPSGAFYSVENNQIAVDSGRANVTDSIVQGLSLYRGHGNSPYDPLFVDPANGNYELQADSPANGAGNPAGISTNTLDLAGISRLRNSQVDLGAYAYPGTPGTPVALATSFSSQSLCGGASAVFSVVDAAGGAIPVTWQVNLGGGFVDVTSDALDTITTLNGGSGSQLTVSVPDTSLNGAMYRYVLGALSITSAPAVLTVSPRTIVYVDAAASGARNGATWTDAFTTLGAAVQVADSCTAIYVATGAYPQSSRLTLPAGVAIYGGFPSGGAFGDRNPTNFPTVISAAGGFSDFLMNASQLAQPGQNNLFDGLQFTNANQAIDCESGAAVVQNCQFLNLPGNAVYFQEVSATLLNCVFRNTPESVQAALSTLLVSDCVFTNDTVAVHPSGSFVNSALGLAQSQTIITNCGFYKYNGVAVGPDDGVVTIYASRFSGNTYVNGGPAIFNYGALVTLNDCLLDRNSSGASAGAIYDYYGTTVVNGSTLVYNTANQSGGVLATTGGIDRFYNCIIWGNSSVGGYGVADLDFSGGRSHSLGNDIVQNPGLAAGSSVIVADPLFNNPAAGDYTLSVRSPAIGAGNSNVPAAGEFDLAGNARVQNGTVDLGAYESGLAANPISLSVEPQTITVCSLQPAVFQVAGNVPYTFQWQYNIGGGWNNVSAGAFIDGATAAISQTATTSSLTLTSLSTNLTGLLVQAVVVGNSYTAAAGLTVVPGGTIYVDASAPAGGDGSSWSKAFNSLIDGLSAITTCSPTVWVAQGTYFPTTTNIYAKDNYPYFRLPAGVSVYGGFPSGGGDWTTRNWITHPTTLTGPPITANYYEYVVSIYQADGVTLDGFNILGAQNLAGIDVEYSNPSLTNLTVTNCSNSGLSLYFSPAQVANCRFVGNSSPNGGGGAQVIGQGASNAVFLDCVFQGNTVRSFGGGLYIAEQCSPQLVNVLITGNQSDAGLDAAVSAYGSGGLFVADSASPTLVNCTVAGNTGGIYAENASHVALVNSIVWGNRYGSQTLESQQVVLQGSGASFDHTTIEGLATYSGTQVTGGDPLFLSPLSAPQAPVIGGDYHLAVCSPFLAMGSPSAVLGVTQDLDGAPRIVGGAVDYGPYELGATAATPLLIITQPLPLTYANGGSGNVFTVVATGTGLSYEWQSGGVSLVGVTGFSGADTATLSVDQSNPALNGSQIRCQVSTASGCATYSTAVTLMVYPAQFYVNAATGNDQNNGLSWSNAFQTLAPAMTAAHDTNETAVWIAAGNYLTPTNISATLATYRVPKNMTLYGGFSGTETNLSQRNLTGNSTIIQVPGVSGLPTSPNASEIFTLAAGAGMDGLTIGGAGVGVFSENVPGNTITNCTFTNCYYGISMQGSTSVSVAQSRFQGNFIGFFLNTGNSVITNCIFTGDNGDLQVNNANAIVTGCRFTGSGVGVGLFSGTLTVMNSAFLGKDLGAVLNGGALTIQDSSFTGNGQGLSSSYGGGGVLVLQRDAFRGNGSTNLTFGGALLLGAYASATIEDCLFSGNVAKSGGAVYDYHSGSTFRNCTLTGNRNFAIVNSQGSENLVNCLLWNNSPASADTTTDPQFLLSLNPVAAPSTNGDFHLGPCSPFIAAGNAGTVGNSTTDLDGQPRLFNGTLTPGAYEPQSSPLVFAVQPANAAGSLGQTVSFTAAVTIPAGVTYQWQVGIGGGAYSNLAEGAPYSGVTTTTLNLAGAPAYNGKTYRLAATFPEACTVYSLPAAYRYFLAGVNLTDVQDDVLRAPLTDVTLNIPGGVNAASANDQSIAVYGMESGRSTLGFTVDGSTLSLNPVNPFHAGESISVTANSNLKTSSGSSVQPYNWQFFNDVNSWDGTFAPPQTLSIAGMTSANTLAIGDLNGDGSLDLFVSTVTGGLILTNDGAGNFAVSGALLGTSTAGKIVLGDIRGLGRLDALQIRNGSLEVWFNNGTGVLSLATSYTQVSVTDIALGDLNNDGYLDLFVVSTNGDQVWLNDGAGNFIDSGMRLADSNATSVALGDFNGDGYLDAVVVGPNSGAVWLNQGGTGFAPGPGGGIYSGYSRVLVADMNNDGKLDLVLARDGAGNQGFVDVWAGTGFGNFNVLAENWSSGTGHGALAVGDVNGDHFPAIVYLTTGQHLAVNFFATTYYPPLSSQGNLGGANATALADLDGDGALDLAIVNPQGKVAVALYQPTQLSGNEGTMLTGFGQTFIDAFARISTNTLTTVTITSLPAQGTLYLSGTPASSGQIVPRNQLSALSYEGVEFYHGRDVFAWQGTDQNGLVSGALDFHITLLLVPHQVVPADDYIAVGRGEAVSTLTNGVASVFANDLNVDGGTLGGGLNTPPAHGSIQFNTDGTFVYTQDGSPTHSDSFSYQVTNLTTGDFAGATVHITITNVNHTPTSISLNSNTVYEGQPAGLVAAQLSAIDPDPAHTQFIYTLVPGAGGNDNAEFAITNNTLVTAVPLIAAQGLTRVVRLRVTDEATAYDSGGAYFEDYFEINVTPLPVALARNVDANENAVTGITLTGTSAGATNYTVVGAPFGPFNGVLSGTPPNLSYTPNPNFFGTDSFLFQVNDGTMNSGYALVSITVHFVNQPPTVTNDTFSTLENVPVNITFAAAPFLASHNLSYQIVSGPNYGTLSGTPPNLIYTPFTNTHGIDNIDFTASDDGLTSQIGFIDINVQHVNQPPVARSSTYQVQENSVGQVVLFGSDPDLDALFYRITVAPAHGTVTGYLGSSQNPPAWTYQPYQNYSGTDSFVFVASDGSFDSNPGTITVNVTPLPSPVAVAQTVYTTNIQTFNLTLSAYDAKGFTNLGMFYRVATGPTNGQLITDFSGSSNYTYTPLANFTGRDSFTFTAIEGGFVSAPATVQIALVPPPPIAFPATYGNYGNATSVVLQATDPNGLPLTYYIIDGPTNGVIDSTNFPRVGYVPNQYYWGTDTFTFGVSNTFGGTASNTITFNIVEPSHAPDRVQAFIPTNIYAGVPLTLGIADVASDVLNDPLTIVGAAVFGGTGTVGATTTFTSNSVTFVGGTAGGNQTFQVVVSNRFQVATSLFGIFVLPRNLGVNFDPGLVVPPGPPALVGQVASGEFATLAFDLPTAVAFANSFGPELEWNIYCGPWPNTTPIVFSSPQTNTLDGSPSALAITGNIVIQNVPAPAGAPSYLSTLPLQLSIDTNAPPMRLFQVAKGARLRLENCLISGGSAPQGGAIYNEGTLEIVGDTLTNNLALGNADGLGLGGAIYNHNGSVAMTNSTLADNTADLAGGIYEFGDGAAASLVVSNCVMSGHGAAYDFYSTNNNGGSSVITSTLLSSANPSQPWFGPLAPSYTVQNSLSVSFPVSYNNFTGGFLVSPVNPWNDASALQIKGQGAIRTLSMSQPESVAQTPQNITVALTNGGVSYAETFTLTVDPSSQNAPVAVADYADVIRGNSVTIPVLANDENPDSIPLTIIGVSNGQFGTVTIAGTNVIYHCRIGSVQLDSFTYQISNGAGIATGTVYVQLDSLADENPTPTSSADSGPGTLRAALDFASQYDQTSVWNITLDPGIDNSNLTFSSFTDTGFGPAAFIISQNIVIDGGAVPGATLEMSTNSPARLFYITAGGSLTLKNIRLTGGVAVPGVYGAGLGGAIYNEGTLILTNVVIDDSTALGTNALPGLGGGIYNRGTVVMNSTAIINNTANFGGGLYQFADGNAVSVMLTNCYFDDPSSGYSLMGFATNNGTALVNVTASQVDNPAPPWLSDPSIGTATASKPVAFTVNQGSTPVSISAISANQIVVPSANLSLTNAGSRWFLGVTPLNNGVAGITLQATAGGLSMTRGFELGLSGAGVINPVVPNSSASVIVGQSVLVPVLANAVSAVGAPLRILSVTPPVAGTAVITNNEVLYANTSGSPTNELLTLVVTNDFGGSATATLAIAVVPYHIDLTSTAEFGDGTMFADLAYIASHQLPNVVWTVNVSSALAGMTASRTGNEIDHFGVFGGSSAYTSFMITNDVIIDASDAPGFTLTVNSDFGSGPPMRIFHVVAGASLGLRNIRLSGGQGAGFGTDSYGGAILNEGTLVCENVRFDHNLAQKFGSGVARGGAICNLGVTAAAAITNCTFTANFGSATTVLGGAVYNENGTVIMDSNILSNNVASDGTGVYNYGNGGVATLELTRNIFTNTSSTAQLMGAATTNGQSIISTYHDSILSAGAPSIAPIADQVTSGAIDVHFVTQLPTNIPAGYTLSATSSDQARVRDGNLTVSGSLTNGTVGITTYGTNSGVARVTLTLANTNFVYAETFDLSVSNLPPFTAPPVPVAMTYAVTGVTPTTATLNGKVNPNGLATTVYFLWGPGATLGNTNLAANLAAGTALVSVSNLLTGLSPHTVYSFQTMAVSAGGTSFGVPFAFTTPDAPEVKNIGVGNLTSTSAILSGLVTARGATCGAWFEWGTTTSYGQTTAVTNIGNNWPYVAVSNLITGLTSGTTYHFQLRATNSAGTVSSGDFNFTTPAAPVAMTYAVTGVSSTTATLNGKVNPNGAATTVYFLWGPGGTLVNTNLAVNLAAGTTLVNVSNLLTGLSPHTVYSFQTMAVSAGGTSFGVPFAFTTPDAPEVKNVGVGDLTLTSAALSGLVTARGATCGVWFEWGATTSYGHATVATNIGNNWPYVGVTNVLTGLTPGTTYHFQMVATNSAGTVSSGDFNFTTPAAPVAMTYAVTEVTPTTATLNGKVNPNGLATTVYFLWGPGGTLVNTNLAVNLPAGSGLINVSNLLTGLSPHTVYSFQTMAVNAGGTNYGVPFAFTTPDAPEVKNIGVGNVTPTSAVLSGLVTARGATCGVWFEWGTTTSYGHTTVVTNIGNYWPYVGVTNVITGLTPGTTYHFQMVATNSAGTVNSGDFNFTTPAAPVAMTYAVTGVGSTMATLNGKVNPNGLATTVYFLWGPGATLVNTNLATSLAAGSATISVSNLLTGLSPHTVYSFQTMAVSAGGTAFGVPFAFTTPDAPEVKNIAAGGVTTNSAVLSGLVTARGASCGAWFEWGATTNYGQITTVTNIGSDWPYVGVSNVITGLAPGTKYHYRMSATNSVGNTNSADLTFTTPASSSDVANRRDGKLAIGSVQIIDLITLADGTRRIGMVATPGQTYVIEAAENPASGAWSVISTNTADTSGEFSLIDPNSVNAPNRFYRLRRP